MDMWPVYEISIVVKGVKFQEEALPYWLARYLWLLFAYIIFHLKLLHAVTQPIHSFLTEGIKSTVYADGHFRRPRFSFSKIRVEVCFNKNFLFLFPHLSLFLTVMAHVDSVGLPTLGKSMVQDSTHRPQVRFYENAYVMMSYKVVFLRPTNAPSCLFTEIERIKTRTDDSA
uniref:Bestrophin homolog n=1 Tax=Parascaris equorum TaxID=6256 RepID=A0A914RHR9_PAREQ